VEPQWQTPSTAAEAALMLRQHPQACLLGGGTLIVPRIARGDAPFARVVDLAGAGLDGIDEEDGGLTLGAMVRIGALAVAPAGAFLAAACEAVGGPALRALATVGGNLAVHGDLAVALAALGAEVELIADGGELRRQPLGAAPLPGLVVRVRVPRPAPGGFGFHKLGRRAHAVRAVVTAAVVEREGGWRVAVGAGHGPAAIAEGGDLEALAADLALRAPLASDAHASAAYRRRMVPVALRRAAAGRR
jgi:CO/xanthine dehydrogenase FAD-binding subunit